MPSYNFAILRFLCIEQREFQNKLLPDEPQPSFAALPSHKELKAVCPSASTWGVPFSVTYHRSALLKFSCMHR